MDEASRELWARVESVDRLLEMLAVAFLKTRSPHEAAATLAFMRREYAAYAVEGSDGTPAAVRLEANRLLEKRIDRLERHIEEHVPALAALLTE